MTRQEIFDDVIEAISNQVYVDCDELSEKTTLHEDLAMDSLDDVEVVMELEDKYNLEISDYDVSKCVTIGDVVDLIDRMVNGQEEVTASAEGQDAEDSSK